MTKMFRNEEAGRSMVEMLGVLAIVGVLSIGGISGYSKAMAKYKVNKTLDQISMLVTNIRSTFGNQNSYTGLDNKAVISYELADLDMSHGTPSTLTSPYSKPVTIAAVSANSNLSFTIKYEKLPKGACASIASANWGDSAASGLVQIDVNGKTHSWNKTTDTEKLPIPFGAAASQCTSDDENSITWTYY